MSLPGAWSWENAAVAALGARTVSAVRQRRRSRVAQAAAHSSAEVEREGARRRRRRAGPAADDRSDLGDLVEVELHRGLPTEDRHQHLELLLVGVDLTDRGRQ